MIHIVKSIAFKPPHALPGCDYHREGAPAQTRGVDPYDKDEEVT